MLKGWQDREEAKAIRHDEQLHVQRIIAAEIHNVAAAFAKGGTAWQLSDVWPIPSIDKELEKARKEQERKQAIRAEHALQKYQNIEKKLKSQKRER